MTRVSILTGALLVAVSFQARASEGSDARAPRGASSATEPAMTEDGAEALRGKARALYFAASTHAQAQEWEDALRDYEASARLFPNASTWFNVGFCRAKLGDPLGAHLWVTRAIAGAELDEPRRLSPERREIAEAFRHQLVERLGVLLTPLEGDVALVAIDEAPPVAVADEAGKVLVAPGAHRIQVRRQERSFEVSIAISAGETVELARVLPPPPDVPDRGPVPPLPVGDLPSTPVETPESEGSPPLRTAGHALLILGGVGLAVGGTAAIVAADKDARLQEVCADRKFCAPILSSEVGAYEDAASTANISLLGGAAAVLGGVGLLLLEPLTRPSPIALTVGLDRVQLRGTF